MSIPVLTAIGDPRWEADLAASLGREEVDVTVVRRCVDLADLLAAAAAGVARAVVLSGDLRRLDRDALSRLSLARVAVVGLAPAGDEAAERRLHQFGVRHVLGRNALAADVAAAIVAAVAEIDLQVDADPSRQWGDPGAAFAELDGELFEATPDGPVALDSGSGRIVAVWGAAGAPGRTTIAINLAAELAALGHAVVLVDADTYGGVVAQLLGVLDEAPGVAAACRLANQGTLDAIRLASLALQVRPGLRLLTGITRPDRWLELRPAALAATLDIARCLAAYVVVDCGFCLEQDEELSYDTVAPRRNAAALTAIGAAAVVVTVAAADPVGLTRFVRARPECAELAAAPPITVVNRLRRGVVGPGDPRREVAAALSRYADLRDPFVVPEDRDALDAAIAAGRTLAEVAPKSPARLAIRDLAAHISGEPKARRRGRRSSTAVCADLPVLEHG